MNVPPCKGHARERTRAETNTFPMGNDLVGTTNHNNLIKTSMVA